MIMDLKRFGQTWAARSPFVPRFVLLGLLVSGFGLAWRQGQRIPLLVIGQPAATGLLQHKLEAPFFAQLQASTGLPIRVRYKRTDEIGFKDVYQVQALKDGTFDLVSLRFIQNSPAEPSLLGIDMPGVIQDHDTARRVVAAYRGSVDRYLQERFNSKLLGVWPFGAQELLCRQPVSRLADLRGLRVRVAGSSLAALMVELGARPAVIPFEDTLAALAAGVVDCAITSGQSANSAGWPQYTQYSFPLAFQFGLNGYAISLKKWNALTPRQQQVLAKAFDDYLVKFWAESAKLQADASRCSTGGVCKFLRPYRLKRLEPSASDISVLRQISRRRILPEWARVCDRVHPGCSQDWQRKVGSIAFAGPAQ
jgi:TRAP-type C4-dicarboxylate transport system substrate-binding protein